jgi:voltage-gated potassium channel
MFKKFIALLKDKPRLYDIIFGSDTPAGRKFDLMVIIAISVSLIVMFVESLQIVDGRFKLAMEIIEGCLTFFFTTE